MDGMQVRNRLLDLAALVVWRAWNIGLLAGWFCTEVIGKFLTGEAVGKALLDFRQHTGIPLVPFADESTIDVAVPILQVGTFQRILSYIEEERVFQNLEELVIAVACRPLGIRLVTPEQFARERAADSFHRVEKRDLGKRRRPPEV